MVPRVRADTVVAEKEVALQKKGPTAVPRAAGVVGAVAPPVLGRPHGDGPKTAARVTGETDEVPVLDPNRSSRTAAAAQAGDPAVAASIPLMDTRRRIGHVVLPAQMAVAA